MGDSKELRTLRQMAWQRAKGELKSMLVTFWADGERHASLSTEMRKFIEEVESRGLDE